MQNKDSATLFVDNISIDFESFPKKISPVRSVSFSLFHGRLTALVGESGCGKSLTALSIMRLLPKPGNIVSGHIWFQKQDLLQISEKEMRGMRGKFISMVFQEPMTSLNPVFTVGNQLLEVLQVHENLEKQNKRNRVIEMLDRVGIRDAELRMKSYPHHLSGGMRQRIMIAMALLCNPQILVADEPTTALDVTVQAQILILLRNLQKQFGMAILFITHDLSIVADYADDVMVMYAGSIVEKANVKQIFSFPLHPYTQGLLASSGLSEKTDESFESLINIENGGTKKKRFLTIEGQVPNPYDDNVGCRFFNRCSKRKDICSQREPLLKKIQQNASDNEYHEVACHLYE